ncbi:hypothetical protein GOP47_0030900, partial [Adiantum capillus-veneris]
MGVREQGVLMFSVERAPPGCPCKSKREEEPDQYNIGAWQQLPPAVQGLHKAFDGGARARQ